MCDCKKAKLCEKVILVLRFVSKTDFDPTVFKYLTLTGRTEVTVFVDGQYVDTRSWWTYPYVGRISSATQVIIRTLVASAALHR